MELENCHFRYQREGEEVLDGISLALYPGEIYALTGANGSGKSTTLRLLCGINRPYLGKIRLNGKVVKKILPQQHGVAALPQDPRCLLVGETVVEDLRGNAGRSSEGKGFDRNCWNWGNFFSGTLMTFQAENSSDLPWVRYC